MEKHPIDSRFKDGLGGFRPQPSADAWARLQSRMAEETTPEVQEEEPQKKRFAIWYSIAAAITLLLLSVGVYRLNFMPEQTNTIASATKTEQTENVINNQPEAQSFKNPEAENQTVIAQNDQQVSSGNTNETVAKIGKNNRTEKQSLKQEMQAQNPASVQIASAGKQNLANKNAVRSSVKNENPATEKKASGIVAENKLLLASNTPVKSDAPSENKPAAGLPENVIEVVVIKSQPQVVLAANQTDEGPEGKVALVKNIFKQARNLKNGEKVDLQEIGIAPDSRLAMETKNIKQNITEKFTKVLEL